MVRFDSLLFDLSRSVEPLRELDRELYLTACATNVAASRVLSGSGIDDEMIVPCIEHFRDQDKERSFYLRRLALLGVI